MCDPGGAGADFALATLDHANLTGANLTDAFLDEASLTGVTWSNTTCPDGTNSDNDFGTCVNNIDDRPPVAKPTIEGLGGTNGWFIGPVTVVWHWTDGNATINPAKCPAQTTSTTQGAAVVISATCFNALGAEGTASETFKIDTTPPAVSVTGVLKNHVYALGRAPKPACRTTDATSGVASAAKVTLAGAGVGKFTATDRLPDDRLGFRYRQSRRAQGHEQRRGRPRFVHRILQRSRQRRWRHATANGQRQLHSRVRLRWRGRGGGEPGGDPLQIAAAFARQPARVAATL